MKQIGSLANSICNWLIPSVLISSQSKIFLEELGAILKIKKFKDKAKVKSVTRNDSIYLTLNEERYIASFSEGENPDKKFKLYDAPTDISILKLEEIQSFQKFGDKYVLPSTIREHDCDTLEPCPICNDGKCPECNGDKTVVCDVCEGSKKCPSCDGSGRYPCYSCNQTGECSYCGGSGEEDCDDCDGDGYIEIDCRACNGTGRYTLRNGDEVDCRVCDGSGIHHTEDCNNCDGTGSVDCHVCDGSGRCEKCGGEGDVECRACHGTGVCGKCRGKGRLKCQNCKGSGLCPSCKGSQTIPCRRCLGTGIYQSFRCISLESDDHTILLKDESIERLLGIKLESVGKRQISKGIPYIVNFGKPIVNDKLLLEYLERASCLSYRNKILQYRNNLIKSDGTPAIDDNIYSKISILVEQFPVVKCSIEYSNELFTFYIIGTDGRVFADKTPSLWDRFCAWLH